MGCCFLVYPNSFMAFLAEGTSPWTTVAIAPVAINIALLTKAFDPLPSVGFGYNPLAKSLIQFPSPILLLPVRTRAHSLQASSGGYRDQDSKYVAFLLRS